MQFKKCAVFGVLITLYLSTDSWCRHINEKKAYLAGSKKNATSSNLGHFRICGSELTDVVLQLCNGNLNPLEQANTNRGGLAEVAEDCCNRMCSMSYLLSYCDEPPAFTPKKTLQVGNSFRSQPNNFRAEEEPLFKGKKKGISEVRVRERKYGNRKWGKSKKRKRSFKWKCAYKSFGHYLQKLERGNGVRDNMAKRKNFTKQLWPSIQIGTISPEMDKFGGQPIVEVKRNKSNAI